MSTMNENLRWLARYAPDWNNNLDRIARGSVGVDWFSSESFPGRIGFSREELRVAKAELADERMDAIAQNVAWAEDERRMNAMNSTYNHWQHLTDDITAYDPPGPTTMPECTFTTPDEDEAWNAMQAKQARYQDTTGDDWIDEAARTFTAEEFRGAMRFSIGKYNRRMGKKDDLIKEIEKMRDYCQRWIDVENGR